MVGNVAEIRGRILDQRKSEHTFRRIKGIVGLGPFLAYQACLNVATWARDVYNPDEHVYPGTGCLKGLGLLFGRKFTPVTAVPSLRELTCVIRKKRKGWTLWP